MNRLRFAFLGLGLLSSAACIDNPNALGSFAAGGDNPIVVGGASHGGAGGSATGGFGNGPGSWTGGKSGVGGGASALVTCRANGQELVLSKVCESREDCVLISGSGSITLPGPPAPSCTTVLIGIAREEEARFAAFSEPANCPPPVGCAPGQAKVQTEDGLVVPLNVATAVRCEVDLCRSYVP